MHRILTNRAVFGGIAALALVAGVDAYPASAATPTGQIFSFYPDAGCLDAESDQFHSPYNDGDPVQMWECLGDSNQNWTFTGNPGSSPGEILNAASGLCLDAENDAGGNPGNDGDKVQMWHCNGSSQQQWDLVRVDEGSAYIIDNRYDYLYLDAQTDATHNPTQDGDRVQLWQGNGTDQQTWDM